MARLKLTLPENLIYQTHLPVQIGHINYGGHLGNDSVLTLCHEVRLQFLSEYNWTELNIDGVGLIMTDSQVIYQGEAFHSDLLQADLYLGECTDYSFELYYQFHNKESEKKIACCKTSLAFFDYHKRKLAIMPESFKSKFKE